MMKIPNKLITPMLFILALIALAVFVNTPQTLYHPDAYSEWESFNSNTKSWAITNGGTAVFDGVVELDCEASGCNVYMDNGLYNNDHDISEYEQISIRFKNNNGKPLPN